jgi:soluble lytic murein transglycosylase-like protein
LSLALSGCSPRTGDAPAQLPTTVAAQGAIWAAIQPLAAHRGLDPLFVYAMVKMESNFDPRARKGEARGLMQVKPRIWRGVTRLPYETLVWNWRTNLAVGVEQLAVLKNALTEKGAFSYPMLWASYHYGMEFTAAHRFDMSMVPRPSDPVSYRLWSGDAHPIDPPK